MPETQPYRDLGGFPIISVADPTGRNPYGTGYSTCIVNADTTFKTNLPLVEIYHMWVDAYTGSSFQVWKNALQWDNVLIGANAWDPSQALPIRSGDTIYFYFNQPFEPGQTNPYNNNNPLINVFLRQPLAYQA